MCKAVNLKKNSRTSSRFFENQPNEICRHLSEKPSKGNFLKPDKLQNHTNEGKGQEKTQERARRKKGREEKKAMVALLVFIMATLEKCWSEEIYLAARGNVFKIPASHICV